jgi:hypothetical protein
MPVLINDVVVQVRSDAYTLTKEEVKLKTPRALRSNYLSLKAIHEALVVAVDKQSETLKTARTRIEYLEACVIQADNMVEIYKNINVNALTKQNEDNQSRNKEIVDMKKKKRGK